MRKKAGSWLIKVIFIAIVIVFVFWGVGSFQEDKANRVASVNGESIGRDAYRRAYNNHLDNLKRRFGDQLTPEMIEKLQIGQQVLQMLINQKLMLQEAKKLNLRVSDQELVETIQSIEAFRSAGIFDNRRYSAMMQQIRMTPEAFEEEQRKDILVDKLRAMVLGGIQVSEGEARAWYDFKNVMVNMDVAPFIPENYKGIEPTEAQLKAFYDENKAAYKTEAEVKVRYFHFKPEEYETKGLVQDSDILAYYEEFQHEFASEKTVEARHILVKVAEDAPEERVAEALNKISNILVEARKGVDFAELAKKYSEGPSKEQGGFLGAFKKDAMVKPFADKAFSMAANEISDPVRTQFGWHIIKVEKVNEASVRSLADATAEIREKLTRKAAREMALEQAESAYDAAFVEGDLGKTAVALKLTVKETDFFNRKGDALSLAEAGKFAGAAFELEDGDISNVLDFDAGFFILQRLETKPEVIQELNTIKADVRLDVIKQLQGEKAKADAEAMLTALKSGADMATEAEKYGIKMFATGFFKRDEMIPQIGFEREIANAAFKLSAENKLAQSVLQGNKGMYLIQLKERKHSGADGFAVEMEKIKAALQEQKEREFFSRWMDQVRAKSEISIDEAFRNI